MAAIEEMSLEVDAEFHRHGCFNSFQFELDRRRPGQSRITTPRNEFDTCEILSGLVNDITIGTPIAVLVRNKDQRSGDYRRPGAPDRLGATPSNTQDRIIRFFSQMIKRVRYLL